MRLVFLGSTRFGLACLRTASELNDVMVVGVVSTPPIFPISYRPGGVVNVTYADTAAFARERGIESLVMSAGMNDPELIDRLAAWSPDLILAAGWHHFVPRAIRDLAPAVGLHASLLPDYAGGAPLVWAMINGETRSGMTMFRLADGVDDGDILGQREFPIGPDDTIASLLVKAEAAGVDLVRRILPALAVGRAVFTPQDASRRRVMPQRGPEDGLIDWTRHALEIDRFVRAQTKPYPGAFGLLDGEKATIWAARPMQGQRAEPPGTLVALPEGKLAAVCGGGLLDIQSVAWRGEEGGGAILPIHEHSRLT